MKRLYRVLVWCSAALLFAGGLLLCVLAWGVLTDSGARRALPLAFAAAAPGLEISAARIDGNLVDGLLLQGLHVGSEADGFALDLQELEFRWQPWELLQRHLQLRVLRAEGLRWQSRTQSAATDAPFDAAVITDWFAAVPVTIELAQVELRDLQLQIDDTHLQLPQIGFSAAFGPQQLSLAALMVEAFDARVEGQLALQQDLALQGSLDWSFGSEGDYAGALQIAGSLAQLQLQHELRLPAAVHSEGVVTTGLLPGQQLELDLQHGMEQLDLARWGMPELSLADLALTTRGTPEALALDLEVQGVYEGFAPLSLLAAADYTPQALRISTASLQSDELSLQLQGSWDLARSALDLAWQLERLDAEQGGFSLAGVNGSGALELALDDGGVTARIGAGPLQGQLNGQALALDGELNLQDSALQSLSLQASSADNRLQVQGALQPALALSWTLEAPLLAQLHPDIAGQVSGAGELAGNMQAPLLTGSLQGTALRLQRDGAVLEVRDLQLSAAAGSTDNAVEMTLQGLSLLRDGENRALLERLQVVANGSPAAHRMQLDAQGMDSILSLALSGSLDERDWQGQVQRVELASPFGPWTLQEPLGLAWRDAALRIDEHCWSGPPMRVCLELSGAGPDAYAATLQASGIPLHWLNRGEAATDKPAALQDLQTAWSADLPAGVALQGVASVTVTASVLRDGRPGLLDAELQAEALQLHLTRQQDPDDAEAEPAQTQRFAVDAQPLRGSLRDGVWRSSTSVTITELQELEAAGEAVLQGTLSADLTLDDEERVGGLVQVAFADLAFVESMVPGLRRPSGRLQGSAQVSGTLSMPAVEADLAISEGAFALPTLGIEVRDFGATVRSSNGSVLLDASGTSGEGALLLQASVQRPFAQDREFSARLEGSDFRLLDTATASATITPSVDLRFSGQALDLRGSLTLSDASLDLESVVADVAEGGVDVSRDAVVVRPDPAAQVAEHQRALPFDALLEIRLGDAVRAKGFGLDAALNGELRLEQEAGRPLLAYGELGIPEGTYRIYNQELNARDGRLLFYGNPLNPVLDVRAFRETPTAEVGMMLSGTIGKLQTRLYSTPTLPENEILAILVTGKSFNNMNDQDGNALLSAVANLGIERGEGLTSMIGNKLGLDSVAINGGASYLESSLGLGKYITPDLLMRYEIGLFDRQAVLSIDYSLTDRIKLEVRSGISQSVDVSYMIEKD